MKSNHWWHWVILAGLAMLQSFSCPSLREQPRPLNAPSASKPAALNTVRQSCKVNPGDRVTIELVATDVVHGLSIDGYNLETTADPGKTASITFTADRSGSFPLPLHGDLREYAPLHDRQAGSGAEHFLMAGNCPGRAGTLCWGVEGAKMTRLQEFPWVEDNSA